MDKVDFKTAIERLRQGGCEMQPDKVHIQIPHAKELLQQGLQYFLGDSAQWLPCYDEIAEWLTDNQGRGLLCVGSFGIGKTLICHRILPLIILNYARKVMATYSAFDINDRIREVMGEKLVVIDDIGTEQEAVNFGERHMAFSEIVDNAEKRSNLLVITTNLRTTIKRDKNGKEVFNSNGESYPSIEAKYGMRTLDRLNAITKTVVFRGKSFRK
ncbi:MAG: hypothetical protein IKH15_12075 [Bacteroidales bacterium]|nr:hypothetical protein [Bacteroidales bacterium]